MKTLACAPRDSSPTLPSTTWTTSGSRCEKTSTNSRMLYLVALHLNSFVCCMLPSYDVPALRCMQCRTSLPTKLPTFKRQMCLPTRSIPQFTTAVNSRHSASTTATSRMAAFSNKDLTSTSRLAGHVDEEVVIYTCSFQQVSKGMCENARALSHRINN